MSFLAGLTAAVLGNVVIGAGQCMQKYALNKLQRDWEARQQTGPLASGSISSGRSEAVAYGSTSYSSAIDMRSRSGSTTSRLSTTPGNMQAAPPRYTSKLWILGLVLNYMGEIFGNAVALSYLSAAVVAPIGIVSVLVNVVLAEKFLHERITRNQRFGFLVIVAGVGCILLVAPRSSGASDATQFVSMVQTSGILGLFALMYMVQAALVMLIRSGRQSLFLYVLVASIFGSMNVMVSKIMTMYLRLKMVFSAMPNPADLVVYGVSGATGSSMLSLPQILVGAVMAGSVIGQESFRQQALGRYPVMQFQPVFFATYNVVATLSGLLLFKELSGWFQGLVFFAMFSVGIALILYGSRFLQKAKSVVLPSHIRLDKENLLKTQ
ncbi:hypothetical protein LPJ79_004050 [Coemansia sp. RSA 1821]|nr:hypothetical protein LPJ68_003749 [Coemansia sp. RSA 1086]KAJ1749034.1 hypothetical protein LPJ79_004050 [Coemansia sp. RSA 1821]KAJ2669190.1 hypothetical protein IWW42_004732 [Coemansia sp. RSA 1085]